MNGQQKGLAGGCGPVHILRLYTLILASGFGTIHGDILLEGKKKRKKQGGPKCKSPLLVASAAGGNLVCRKRTRAITARRVVSLQRASVGCNV